MRRSLPTLLVSGLVALATPPIAGNFAHAFSAAQAGPELASRGGSLSSRTRRGWGTPPAINNPRAATARPFAATGLRMMFHKQPGESEAAFMKRIQQLAADPKAFERAALGQSDPAAAGMRTPTSLHSCHSSNGTETSSSSLGGDGAAAPARRRGGYQRVEDWDREQQEHAKSLSWEERVQFDGQRHGNRFQQNEILRHHLRTF